MRHLTSGSRYKLFLKLVALGVLFFWAVTLFTASPQGASDTSRPAALELLSMSSFASSASTPTTATAADDSALHRLEAEYARERQERLELQRSLEQLQTKQQDLQGQLDILRQQMPLPEDQVEGAAKPPEIGYTKWAKNYYNTRRDDAGSGPDDIVNKNDNEQQQQQQDKVDSINLSGTGIALPRFTAETEEGEARRKKAQAAGLEASEGGQCVLPQALDYKKDFWAGRPFVGCCRAGNCGRYQLRDRGRLLLSKCDEPATISWATETRTVAPDQLFSLSTIPQGNTAHDRRTLHRANQCVVDSGESPIRQIQVQATGGARGGSHDQREGLRAGARPQSLNQRLAQGTPLHPLRWSRCKLSSLTLSYFFGSRTLL